MFSLLVQIYFYGAMVTVPKVLHDKKLKIAMILQNIENVA